MRFFRLILLVLILQSCSTRQENNPLTTATRFNIDLANAYIGKASEFSYSDNGGWNSLRMEEKASQAASGQTVYPYIADAELLGSETFADKLNALRDLFTHLLHKYPTDTKLDNPKLTAFTQAALDCWILGNSYEVNKSFNQGICKRQFLEGLGRLIKITKNHMKFRNFSENVNSVFFRFDSYYLTEDAIYRLNHAIKELNKVTGATLMLYGYTDNVGSPAYNKFLAQQRLNTVKKFLIDSGIITKNNICIDEVILGEFDPLISQQTVNNNPHSRRVDIFVMR